MLLIVKEVLISVCSFLRIIVRSYPVNSLTGLPNILIGELGKGAGFTSLQSWVPIKLK